MRSVAFSRDETQLLTASDDKTLKVWSLPARRFQGTLQGHSNWVRSGAFSPDGGRAVSGSDDKTVKIWDVGERTCLHTFYDHEGTVRCTGGGRGDGGRRT